MKCLIRHIYYVTAVGVLAFATACSSDSDAIVTPQKPDVPVDTSTNLKIAVGVRKDTRSIVVGPNDVLSNGEENLTKIYVNTVGTGYGDYETYEYGINSISNEYEWQTQHDIGLSGEDCTLYASNVQMYSHSASATPMCYYFNRAVFSKCNGIEESGTKYRVNNKDTLVYPTDYLYAAQPYSIDSISGSNGSYYTLNNKHTEAELDFKHVNARLKLSFTRGTYSGTGNIYDLRIILVNPAFGTFVTRGAYDASTGKITKTLGADSLTWNNSGKALDVLPTDASASSDFTTFVAPFYLNSRFKKYQKFNLRFKIDTKEMELDDLTFNEGWYPGKIYEYQIKVNNMTLHLQNVKVTAWMPDISNSYVLE